MFEEVQTINWTCDFCGLQTMVQNIWRNRLNRPEGWTITNVENPLSMFETNKDMCQDCSDKKVPNAHQ